MIPKTIPSRDAHTDQVLIQMLRQGDEQAFAALYQRYWRRLFDAAYKRLRNREATEEVVQDLFVHLWLKKEQLLITTSLDAYLFTALRYRIYNVIRDQLARKAHLSDWLPTTVRAHNPVEEALNYQELTAAFRSGVESLPEKYRRVYQLSRQENRSYKEIAQYLDLPLDTVEKQMGKALKLLRLYLKDYIITLLLAGSLLR